jgi:O-antigen ligase
MTPWSDRAGVAALRARVRWDELGIELEWAEFIVAMMPLGAWLLAGISDSPKLATAAYLVVGAMLIIRPHVGYLALIPLLFFFHARGFEPHGPMFALSAVALTSVLVRLPFTRTTVPRSTWPAIACALGLLGLGLFQLILGVGEFPDAALPLRAVRQYDQLFIILTAFVVGLIVLPNRPLGPFHIAYLIGLVIVGAVAIVNFADPRLLQGPRLSWLVPDFAQDNRASGIIASTNSLGLAMACGFVWIVVTMVIEYGRGRLERVTWLAAALPSTATALLLSFSRSAILASAAGMLAALARRSLRAAALAAVGAVIAAVLIYPVFVNVRLGQTFGEASPAGQAALGESDRLRTLMAKSAVKAFLDAPLLGHGYGTFGEISPRYSGQNVLTSAHDIYLKVAAEQGLVGLAVLAALGLAVVIPLWRAGVGPWTAGLAVAVTFGTSSLTLDSFSNAQSAAGAFFLIAAGLAQAGVVREGLRRSTMSARPDGARWVPVDTP